MTEFILLRKLAILLLVLPANVALSDDGVYVTEPNMIAALNDLQDKIDATSAAVGDCVKSGKEHPDCLCENEGLISTFNRTVEALFVAYPDLLAVDIVRFRAPGGLLVSQSLFGIRNQARTELSCK